MPHVWIRTKCEVINEKTEELRLLVKKLPILIARALSTPPGTAGELNSEEIDVDVTPFGPMGIHHFDVEIMIFANDYPERAENLDDRAEKLSKEIKKVLSACNLRGYVWPLLGKGAFKEF